VPQHPERPFVPHRTPARPRPAVDAPSEFRLAKPFVPGASRGVAQSFQAEVRSPLPTAEMIVPLPGIDQFLAPEPPSPIHAAATPDDDYLAEAYDDSNELPPVEHFLDPLPAVTEFSHGELSSYPTADDPFTGHIPPAPEASGAASEWLETDWQNFDWRGAAALGETAATEASSDWSNTDWEASAPRPRTGKTAAHAIAKALDEIAQRIRDGELAVPGPAGTTDPATIAATLATLLGIRK
jgi:hypothetical protein